MASLVIAAIARAGTVYQGTAYITGTVTVAGVAAQRQVLLRHRRSGLSIATTFSAADGTYRFDLLNPAEEYDVIVRDYTRTYKDYVEPAVVPAT